MPSHWLHKSLVCWLFAATAFSQVPVGWRGNGTGAWESAHPPLKWSLTSGVAWACEMPARSNSQPIVVGDKVFICSEPFDLLCLQLSDGKILWRRSNTYRDITDDQRWSRVQDELAVAEPLRKQLEAIRIQQEELKSGGAGAERRLETLELEVAKLEEKLAALPLAASYTLPVTQEEFNGYSTATPTSDGRFVWAVFGNRVVVCYDLDGKLIWSDVLSDMPHSMWGHSASPLLVGDKLIVNMEHTMAFEAGTGRRVWQTRLGQTWGSAVSTQIGGENLILLANGRILRASDGKVLKRVIGLENASPIVQDGVAYYIGQRAEAHELPSSLQPGADSLELKTRWSIQLKGGAVYASPIVYDGLIYTISTQKVLNVIEAQTGEVITTKRLTLGEQPAWSSLCLAGEYLYVSSRDGTTQVLKAGRSLEEIARNQLEYFISSPAFHGDQMFVRTSKRLYCIGGK